MDVSVSEIAIMKKLVSKTFLPVAIVLVIILIGIAGLYFASGGQSHNADHAAQPDVTSATFVNRLKAADGSTLGDLFGVYSDEKHDVFSALYILQPIQGGQRIIFKATAEGLFNTQGKLLGPVEQFYGYELSSVNDDSFVVRGVANQGKSISKELTIKWDPVQQAFEVVGVPTIFDKNYHP
jgi:hypothetical protein